MTAHKKVCKIEGCGRVHLARGWCRPHYVRWHTHGDPQPDVPITRRKPSAAVESLCDDCGYVASSLRALAAHRSQAHRAEQEDFVGLGEPSDGWQAKAACADLDTDLFFVGPLEQPTAAKKVCTGCPVRTDCLTYALRTHQDYGVWGGLTPDERKSLRRRYQRQRKAAA